GALSRTREVRDDALSFAPVDVPDDRVDAHHRLQAPAVAAGASRPSWLHDEVPELARAAGASTHDLPVHDDPGPDPAHSRRQIDDDERSLSTSDAELLLVDDHRVDVVVDRRRGLE